MEPTKSCRPRQVEEESDAGAPNLAIVPDHEDDTTKQGSGDVGVPNFPIEPDQEDEDGDNGSHSPTDYLNFNHDDIPQVENEEDSRNAEHEGDENEEDEGNTE
jgi:hypothetical protein